MSDTTQVTKEALFDHVDAMVADWASAETTKLHALEGLAFSLLATLDGEDVTGGSWLLYPIDDDGMLGENIAGDLHDLWAERKRRVTVLGQAPT